MEIAAMNTMASSVDRERLRELAGRGGGVPSAWPPSNAIDTASDNLVVRGDA
jgi:hypothetical protein